MSRLAIPLLIALCLLLLLGGRCQKGGGGQPPPPPDELGDYTPDAPSLIAFGDSLTAPGWSWLHQLDPSIAKIDYAIPGWTAEQTSIRVQEFHVPNGHLLNADAAVVLWGTNDAVLPGWEDMPGAALQGVDAILAAIPLVYVFPPPVYVSAWGLAPEEINARLVATRQTLVPQLEARGVAWVDLFELFDPDDPDPPMLDGIHPNDEGHALIAAFVEPVIRAELGLAP